MVGAAEYSYAEMGDLIKKISPETDKIKDRHIALDENTFLIPVSANPDDLYQTFKLNENKFRDSFTFDREFYFNSAYVTSIGTALSYNDGNIDFFHLSDGTYIKSASLQDVLPFSNEIRITSAPITDHMEEIVLYMISPDGTGIIAYVEQNPTFLIFTGITLPFTPNNIHEIEINPFKNQLMFVDAFNSTHTRVSTTQINEIVGNLKYQSSFLIPIKTHDFAVDANGYYYFLLVEPLSKNVHVYSPEGDFIETFDLPTPFNTFDIYVDSQNNLSSLGTKDIHIIEKYSPPFCAVSFDESFDLGDTKPYQVSTDTIPVTAPSLNPTKLEITSTPWTDCKDNYMDASVSKINGTSLHDKITIPTDFTKPVSLELNMTAIPSSGISVNQLTEKQLFQQLSITPVCQS